MKEGERREEWSARRWPELLPSHHSVPTVATKPPASCEAAPLVEEKRARPEQGAAPKGESFTDSVTGVEIRLADLLKALE